MDEAVSLGINLFDTAHSYAGGASERFIGEWLAAQPAETCRDLHIATKVGVVATDKGMSIDLSPRNILDQLSGSLARLGISRVGEPPPPDSRLALRPEGLEPSQDLFDRITQLKREACAAEVHHRITRARLGDEPSACHRSYLRAPQAGEAS